MTTTALAKPIATDEWAVLQMLASTIFESHLYPGIGSTAGAAVVLLTARDLGIPYTAALQGIHMINGKPSISPALAWGIIRASGQLKSYSIVDFIDDKGEPGCTVTMERIGWEPYTITITVEDARRAGILKPGGGWEAWPANMTRWRAIGFVEDIVFPDLLFGIRRSDEFGAEIDQQGNVIIEAEAA